MSTGAERDVASLGGASSAEGVEETDQGIAPFVAAILVGFAVNAGYDVVKQGWKTIIWPRIEKRLGGLALGEELPQADAKDEEETGSAADERGQ